MISINSWEIASIISLLFLFSVVSYGQGDNGLNIAHKMKARQKGFVNYEADMEMMLINTMGKKKVRRLRVFTQEVDGDGEQSLAVFDSPADIRGTGFLSHTHIKKNDMQWLYLPSLKRVKRISPRNKIAPFMGSEFSYEDLSSYEVENYTYQYAGNEKMDGKDYFILIRFPVDKYSRYSRQRVWVEKNRYLPKKIEYYNRKNIKIKTLRSEDFKLYLDRFWFAGMMTMKNHLSGKTSILYWKNYRFNQPLKDSDFKPNSLKRIY